MTDELERSDARDIRDGICAYLQGGFGNQLFILAAALQQSRRLGCPLYVDVSRFTARDPLERGYETPREFELGVLPLPATIIDRDSPWLANSPRRPGPLRRPGRRSAGLRVFREPRAGGAELIDSVRPGTTLFGYFQSPAYFDQVAGEIAGLFDDARLTEAERSFVGRAEADERLTAHLRRGDYLLPGVAAHHGIASAGYAIRGLRLLRRLTGIEEVRVFSDSPEVVAEELGDDAHLDIVDPASAGPVATVRAMAAGRAMLMSNSSFSWWAAFLMRRRRPDAPLVAPRPWLASDPSLDLVGADWITLGA